MKRSLTIIIILLSAFYVNAQDNALKSDYPIRKMEVFGYATANLAPNEIYTSFVIKEYTDNNKIVSIKESETNILKIIKSIGCDVSDFSIGNIYGYITYNGPNNEEGQFEHRRLYLLKLSSVKCIDIFLDSVDPRALESFNIDEMDNNDIDSTVRELQLCAFDKAREKAIILLKTYGEECGRVLDIQEIDRSITYPDFTGKGSKSQVVNGTGTRSVDSNQSRTKSIKVEYQVKVTFEIK
jgi:uncharacterized protein YggE